MLCLRDGAGVPKDLTEGVKYFKMLAKHSYASAQNMYGVCLRDSKDVTENLTKAVKYFKKPADQE
jgi:TPR repeat protein